jgi:hypothetical protein
MLITTTHKIRAVLAVAAATIVATVGLGYGQAHAAPVCTASGLSSALGQVASSTGAWLSAHPEAEAAVNTADENAIRPTSPPTRLNGLSCTPSPPRCDPCASLVHSRSAPLTSPGSTTRWRADQ